MTSPWCLMPDNVNIKNRLKNDVFFVPMSERSSESVVSAIENENIIKMAEIRNATQNGLNVQELKPNKALNSAIYGGMSLWFLLVAVLICVVLFSSFRKN